MVSEASVTVSLVATSVLSVPVEEVASVYVLVQVSRGTPSRVLHTHRAESSSEIHSG